MVSSILKIFQDVENPETFAAGNTVFIEGEPGYTMYVVLKGHDIGLDDLIRDLPQACRLPFTGQAGQHHLLEGGQRGNRLGQKAIRSGLECDLFPVQIAGGAKDHVNAGFGRGQFADQIAAAAVRQSQIDDHDGGAVDLQVTAGRAQAIRAPDSRTAAQAQQAHRFTGKAAVLDHQARDVTLSVPVLSPQRDRFCPSPPPE